MMRVVIFAAGSQGEIQPCIRLGKGLQGVGYEILLAAPQNFADLSLEYGLPFHSLRGDVQKIMAGDTGREFMERSGANPIQSITAMRKMLGVVAIQMAEDALEASRKADAFITLAVFAPFGKTIAEILDIPLILVEPTPTLPTRDFIAPGFPIQKNLEKLFNRLSGFAMLEVIWRSPSPSGFTTGEGLFHGGPAGPGMGGRVYWPASGCLCPYSLAAGKTGGRSRPSKTDSHCQRRGI